MGTVYTVAAVLAGVWFTWESHRLYKEAKVQIPQKPNALVPRFNYPPDDLFWQSPLTL